MTVLPGLAEGPVGLWARAWGGQCPQVCAHRCVGTGETREGSGKRHSDTPLKIKREAQGSECCVEPHAD